MENTEEIILNHEIQMLKEDSSSFQSETGFTYQGIAVHLTFTENGRSIDDLLINYFKNLKQS